MSVHQAILAVRLRDRPCGDQAQKPSTLPFELLHSSRQVGNDDSNFGQRFTHHCEHDECDFFDLAVREDF